MKVIEDAKDKYGNYCIVFKSTNLKQIYEWLFDHYGCDGYKFAIVLDVSDGDYEEPTETHVYFLDSIAREVASYSGLKLENRD